MTFCPQCNALPCLPECSRSEQSRATAKRIGRPAYAENAEAQKQCLMIASLAQAMGVELSTADVYALMGKLPRPTSLDDLETIRAAIRRVPRIA